MKITAGTIARTIILALALINQVLVALGISPLEIGDETITNVVSLVFTIGASVVAWWKNNSFTSKAIAADQYMRSNTSEDSVDALVESTDEEEEELP